jgi:hypothetical protein
LNTFLKRHWKLTLEHSNLGKSIQSEICRPRICKKTTGHVD